MKYTIYKKSDNLNGHWAGGESKELAVFRITAHMQAGTLSGDWPSCHQIKTKLGWQSLRITTE